MGFARFADLDDAKIYQSLWRKTTSLTAVANYWYDDSMLAGTPPANFYASAPLEAATLDYRDGIRHWLPGSHSEHLLESMVFGGAGTLEAPAQFLLADYLLYYPFIDGNSADAQDFDNTVTLPRFTDGVGVQMFLAVQGTGGGNGAYSISYTNQDGVSGRTATGSVPVPGGSGMVLTSGGGGPNTRAPFIGLQSGDTGVRSVEQFTWTGQPGGICALVLCKPIAQFNYLEIGTPAEQVFFPRFPAVHGEAFLGLLRCAQLATPNARTYTGLLTTIRS